MKKRIPLQALVTLILLLVLICFLTTCEELGYHPSIKGISVKFFDGNGKEIDISDISTSTSYPITLVISCIKPSSVKDEDIAITLNYTGLILKGYSSGKVIRGQQTITITVTSAEPGATLTVTSETGGVSVTTGSGGGNVAVALNSVTANGDATTTTTRLSLNFDKAVPGLNVSHITLSSTTGATRGTLTGSGPTYTLAISGVTSAGPVSVAVANPTNVTISGSPQSVTINYAPTAVAFSGVTANGSSTQTTTQLTLTFSQAITGLTANDITLSGVSGVSKGTLSGSGPSYTLPISGFTSGGTLTVVVTAPTGYTISGSPKSVTIYYAGTPINIAAIPGVTAPVAGATPVTAITETAQYTGTVTWDNGNPATFAASTVYTATITLSPKTGYTLTGVTANFFTVAGATSVTNAADSGVVTAVFPATDATITIAAIEGVTAPVAGATPVTAITETAQYTGTVSWNGNPATFAPLTAYTATITLTPKTGFTLYGVAANFFTVAGASSVTNTANTGTVTAVFPATGPVGINATITFVISDASITRTGTADAPFTYGDILTGGKTLTFTLDDSAVSVVTWDMDGTPLGSGATLTINSTSTFLSILTTGDHVINVSGTKDGADYSANITITVNNN